MKLKSVNLITPKAVINSMQINKDKTRTIGNVLEMVWNNFGNL